MGSKEGSLLNLAATMAAHGIATIGINAAGYGFGPLGPLGVELTDGGTVTFASGGRGIDQNGDGIFDNGEGTAATSPRSIIGQRDSQRQTAADFMQLVRVIQVGVDVDGDSVPDLDPSRIYYLGGSQGGAYGIPFLAIEPSVGVGIAAYPGGLAGRIDLQRLRPANRTNVGAVLAARIPSLVNAPGITALDGVSVSAPYFNENMPLRDGAPLPVRLADGTSQVILSPVSNTVAGAMEIQELFDNWAWAAQSGDAAAFAAHLRKDPLPGVPAKSVIIQFGKGDQTAPNPRITAILRAGDLADRATYYRNDLAHAEDSNVPKNPHGFLENIRNPDPLVAAIALGAQEQAGTFFASEGTEVIHPEPPRFFETPIQGPLPEDLNFIP
jgi:hypothetical protein